MDQSWKWAAKSFQLCFLSLFSFSGKGYSISPLEWWKPWFRVGNPASWIYFNTHTMVNRNTFSFRCYVTFSVKKKYDFPTFPWSPHRHPLEVQLGVLMDPTAIGRHPEARAEAQQVLNCMGALATKIWVFQRFLSVFTPEPAFFFWIIWFLDGFTRGSKFERYEDLIWWYLSFRHLTKTNKDNKYWVLHKLLLPVSY